MVVRKRCGKRNLKNSGGREGKRKEEIILKKETTHEEKTNGFYQYQNYQQGLLSTEEYQQKMQMSATEQEYIDLILEFMRMTFKGKIKGFEVKNAAKGKLKIIIK